MPAYSHQPKYSIGSGKSKPWCQTRKCRPAPSYSPRQLRQRCCAGNFMKEVECGISLTVASEQRASLLADPRACCTHPATSAHTKPAGEQTHTGRVRRRGRGWRARDGRGSPGCAASANRHSGAQTNFARSAKYGSAAIVSSPQKLIQEVDSILMTKERDLVLWLVLCDVN
jgi:hypothetical protein